jgi:hypothetical protein
MRLEARSTFAAPHLLTPSFSDRANFAIGTGDLFVTGTAGVTAVVLSTEVKEDPLYLLAVLNSAVLSNYVIEHSPPYQGGFYKFSKPYLRDLPIRRIDWQNPADQQAHEQLVGLARQLVELHNSRDGASDYERAPLARAIQQVEGEINAKVFALYGIDANEAAAISGD